ncbi:hypothetical protein E2C01_056635 [Portunus trituberculatus]|uniref:Uncharacterized protein n=1 Tax=Portunus trituberculatus TaxID=210409 RepID=A0A5B7GY81_PORTR|nr:hypothetical protein [Portunus trituberculatus]
MKAFKNVNHVENTSWLAVQCPRRSPGCCAEARLLPAWDVTSMVLRRGGGRTEQPRGIAMHRASETHVGD